MNDLNDLNDSLNDCPGPLNDFPCLGRSLEDHSNHSKIIQKSFKNHSLNHSNHSPEQFPWSFPPMETGSYFPCSCTCPSVSRVTLTWACFTLHPMPPSLRWMIGEWLDPCPNSCPDRVAFVSRPTPIASHPCPMCHPDNRTGQPIWSILQGSKWANLARIERIKSCKDRTEQILQGSTGANLARIERINICKDRKEQSLQGSKGANLARIERSKSCKDRMEQILQGSKGANLARIERSKSCNDRNQQQNFLNNIECFLLSKSVAWEGAWANGPTSQFGQAGKATKTF